MKIETIPLADGTLEPGDKLTVIEISAARRDEVRSGLLESLPGSSEPELLRQTEVVRSALADAFDPGRQEELARVERERAEAEKRMLRARSDQRRAALSGLSAARGGAVEAQRRRDEALSALTDARNALAAFPYGDSTPDEADKRTAADADRADALAREGKARPSPVPGILALVGALAAFLLSFLLTPRSAYLAAGGVLLLLGGGLLVRFGMLRRRCAACLAERERILSAYGVSSPTDMRALAERYSEAWSLSKRAENLLAEAENALERARGEQESARSQTLADLDFTGGDSEAARAGREAEELKGRAAALRSAGNAAIGRARAALEPKGDEPLVLEDVFAGLDDATAKQVLSALRAAAERRQVLLLCGAGSVSAACEEADVCRLTVV